MCRCVILVVVFSELFPETPPSGVRRMLKFGVRRGPHPARIGGRHVRRAMPIALTLVPILAGHRVPALSKPTRGRATLVYSSPVCHHCTGRRRSDRAHHGRVGGRCHGCRLASWVAMHGRRPLCSQVWNAALRAHDIVDRWRVSSPSSPFVGHNARRYEPGRGRLASLRVGAHTRGKSCSIIAML